MATSVKDALKKTGKTDGEPNKLGGGGRFKQLEKKGVSAKLAAWIGDRKYGTSKMHKWASASKKKG